MARKITLKPRTCKGCGIEFQPANGRQKYHSKKCREENAPYGNGKPSRGPTPDLLAQLGKKCDQEIVRLRGEQNELERKRDATVQSFGQRIAQIEEERARVERVHDALSV